MLAGDKRAVLRVAHELENEVVVAVDVFVDFRLIDVFDIADGDIRAVRLKGWAVWIVLDKFAVIEVEGAAIHGDSYARIGANCADERCAC